MAGKATITFVIKNQEALDAFVEATHLAVELANDQPWNDTARELVEKLQLASNGLEVKQSNT